VRRDEWQGGGRDWGFQISDFRLPMDGKMNDSHLSFFKSAIPDPKSIIIPSVLRKFLA
jgi:hypothetical protein